jgi:hypothetical protein
MRSIFSIEYGIEIPTVRAVNNMYEEVVKREKDKLNIYTMFVAA